MSWTHYKSLIYLFYYVSFLLTSFTNLFEVVVVEEAFKIVSNKVFKAQVFEL